MLDTNFKDSPQIQAAKSNEENEGVRAILAPLARAALNVYFPATDKNGNPDLARFFLEKGRLPHITDEIKPWRYQGWLLPYVMEIQRVHPLVADRWGYHLATLDAGRLLDERIPQINFLAEFDREVIAGKRELEKWETIVARQMGVWDGFRALVDWFSFALGVESAYPALDDKINELLYRNVNIGPWLLNPCDYLGSYLAERKAGGWNPNAFFPTPHQVVEVMVRINFGDPANSREKDARRLKVLDPCVGTGRMLLHASNYSLRLYGQDIDALVVKITKINGALYAPWLAFPFPDEIFDESKSGSAETKPAGFETKQPVDEIKISSSPELEQFFEMKPAGDETKTVTPNLEIVSKSPPEIVKLTERSRKKYRTNEKQGLLFDFD